VPAFGCVRVSGSDLACSWGMRERIAAWSDMGTPHAHAQSEPLILCSMHISLYTASACVRTMCECSRKCDSIWSCVCARRRWRGRWLRRTMSTASSRRRCAARSMLQAIFSYYICVYICIYIYVYIYMYIYIYIYIYIICNPGHRVSRR